MLLNCFALLHSRLIMMLLSSLFISIQWFFYWLCWNPLLVVLFCSNNVLSDDWKMGCWRGWVLDAGSNKSFVEVGSGHKSQLLHFTKKNSVSSEEHGWGISKPKTNLIPESEPKANPNPAQPVHFCLDVHLKTSALPPCPCPPTARSTSSRPQLSRNVVPTPPRILFLAACPTPRFLLVPHCSQPDLEPPSSRNHFHSRLPEASKLCRSCAPQPPSTVTSKFQPFKTIAELIKHCLGSDHPTQS